MEYCLKKGSPKYISGLKDYRDEIGQLGDRFTSRRLATLVESILELLGQTGNQGRGRELERQPSLTSSQDHLSPSRNSLLSIPSVISSQISASSLFSSQDQIKDLTPFVTLKSPHAFTRGGYAAVYLAKLIIGNHSEDVRIRYCYLVPIMLFDRNYIRLLKKFWKERLLARRPN